MSENPTLADCVSRWPVPSQVRINPQCVTLSLSCEDTIRAYKSGWIRLDVDNVYRMGGFEYEDVSKILVKFGLTIGNRELYYEGKPINPTFILPTVEELAYTGAITPYTPPPPSLPHSIGTVIRFHVDKMADKSLVYSLRANGKFVRVGNPDTGNPSFAAEDCIEGRYPGPYNIISLPSIATSIGTARARITAWDMWDRVMKSNV